MLNENHEKDFERAENLIAVRNLNKSFANAGISIDILKGLNFDHLNFKDHHDFAGFLQG